MRSGNWNTTPEKADMAASAAIFPAGLKLWEKKALEAIQQPSVRREKSRLAGTRRRQTAERVMAGAETSEHLATLQVLFNFRPGAQNRAHFLL